MSLFNTGIRPIIDAYLTEKSKERRNYGEYWSASSAGYCMRLNILKRLEVPSVPEIAEDAVRTQRVFEAGHIFHEWAQRITKDAGLSIAQELELQDEDLMVRGHIDDLVLVKRLVAPLQEPDGIQRDLTRDTVPHYEQSLILYDYKTANSQSFNYKKDEIGYYHKMQLGTYMYMLRNGSEAIEPNAYTTQYAVAPLREKPGWNKFAYPQLTEGRILTISKDDLRMREHQLLWSDELEQEIQNYWIALNAYWRDKTLPPCTCHLHDKITFGPNKGIGFMAVRSTKGKIYNNYFYNEKPCNTEWFGQFKDKLKDWAYDN